MDLQTLEPVLIGVAVLVFVTARQLRWQAVSLRKLLRMPIMMVVGGLVSLPGATDQLPAGWHLGGGDLVAIRIELLVAVGTGWALGRLTEFQRTDATTAARLRRPGVAVWVGFIAVRISLGLAAADWGAALAALPATVFFVIAMVKVTQVAVIRRRLAQHRAAEPREHVSKAPDHGRALDRQASPLS